MNVYDELKYLKNFVYKVKDQYFIIGYGVFLDCPSNIKSLYDDFIERVGKSAIEIEKNFPSKQVFNDCIESFKVLIKAILEKTYDIFDEYKKELQLLDESLTEVEKEEIKHQKELYIFFLELVDMFYLKFDTSIDDWYKIKELKL